MVEDNEYQRVCNLVESLEFDNTELTERISQLEEELNEREEELEEASNHCSILQDKINDAVGVLSD